MIQVAAQDFKNRPSNFENQLQYVNDIFSRKFS